jgi:transposase
MDWRRILAYITGTVDQELLLRNEFLAAENKILRAQIKGRLHLTDPERKTLAEIGKRLGRKALEEVASVVKPDTLLGWYRKLVARKYDSSKVPRTPGRPRKAAEVEKIVLSLARENRSWGYRRIVGALTHLGIQVSHETVGDILKRHGLDPAPERRKGTSWAEFIRSHKAVFAACDFFTAETLTLRGIVTYYCLFFIKIGTREVHLAGVTPHPNETWMKQVARNLTMAGCGFLSGMKYLIYDRDSIFTEAFRAIVDDSGVELRRLPAKSPNLNAFAERWVRSVKEECLSRLILFGEASLRHALEEYLAHYHRERTHQGLSNTIPFPSDEDRIGRREGQIGCRQRLGGLLKFYRRVG